MALGCLTLEIVEKFCQRGGDGPIYDPVTSTLRPLHTFRTEIPQGPTAKSNFPCSLPIPALNEFVAGAVPGVGIPGACLEAGLPCIASYEADFLAVRLTWPPVRPIRAGSSKSSWPVPHRYFDNLHSDTSKPVLTFTQLSELHPHSSVENRT